MLVIVAILSSCKTEDKNRAIISNDKCGALKGALIIPISMYNLLNIQMELKLE